MIRRPALFLLSLLALAGCGKSPNNAPSAASESAVQDVPVQMETGGEIDPIADPKALKGGSFTTWGGAFPQSLNAWLDGNPQSAIVSPLLFEPLVGMHTTKDEPVGILADSWEISPDQKTFTFKINPHAKWSDGQPVTAEDVQFYYDVMMNPKNLTSSYRVELSRFHRPEVIDAKTLRVTANQVHWANFWAASGLYAFPKHAWKDVDFNKQNFEFPVVSGPYALSEVKMNRSVTLKRRGDWWGREKLFNAGKYNFDYLVIKAVEDRNKALEIFKSGGFDLFAVYTAQIWAEKTNFPQVQKNWIVRQEVSNKEPKGWQGLVMNLRRPLFQDPKVREALGYLFNVKLMNDKLMFNQYFALNSYFPDLFPNNQNPAAPMPTYDPARARALLKEAGWEVGPDGILKKNGQPFAFTIMHYEASDLRHLNIYLQDLKAIGIDAKIDLISMATFSKRADNFDFDMYWQNTGAARLRDPEPLWSTKTADEVATANRSGVKDPEIDRLIELQKTEMDLGKRNAILKQIDDRLVVIRPTVLMWQSAKDKLLYWNKFGTPRYVLDKFDREDASVVYWWYDPARAEALAQAEKSGAALPPLPPVVVYPEE